MKKAGWLLLLLFTGLATLSAQSLSRQVSLHYDNEPIDLILIDISRKYAVRFIYSSDFVPVHERASVDGEEIELREALDQLFANTPIVYVDVSGNIVLKADPKKQPPGIGQRPTPVEPAPLIEPRPRDTRITFGPPLEPIGRPELHVQSGGSFVREWDLEKFRLPTEAEVAAGKKLETYRRLAQVSLLPYIGTNAERSDEMTNNFSFNLLWGTNGGVEGMEIGGFVNHITQNVTGVQVAGFGNFVEGEITGTQVSGLFNIGSGPMTGVQVGGLFNRSGATQAVQVAGLFNLSDDIHGVQVSALFNVARGAADAVQAAGLFNASNGPTKTQISGLFNRAGDISVGQVSPLLNIARRVEGFQIGLINVADTIRGTPIGLLNLIRHGYNRVELGSGEALHANLGLKLGAYTFYNIFHFGLRWEERLSETEALNQQNASKSWALGYGLGTTIGVGPRTLINVEVVSLHVNEREGWTRALNQLNQLRLTFDWRAGQRTSFFAGPTGNLMLSKRTDAEGVLIGSTLAPYALHEGVKGKTQTQMWVGLNAGVRF